MHIGGLQKVSLVDYPDHIAAVIFTIGCPFRCGFCHNPSLVIPPFGEKLSETHVFDYLKRRRGVLDSTVITGGEPTVHADLLAFIKKLKQLDYKVKLDTCGYLPYMLKKILDSGLIDYVAMDIKAPLPKYPELVQRTIWPERILQSIDIILSSGIRHEFRSTLIDKFHTREDILQMAKLVEGGAAYYLQKFRPAPSLINNDFHAYLPPSDSVLQSAAEECQKYVTYCGIR